MPTGDAQETRRRLVEAAYSEFAAHGIAGARVDRVAATAGVNKALIYFHFGNKEGLFTAVFEQIVNQTLAEAPMDAADLPGYAGPPLRRRPGPPGRAPPGHLAPPGTRRRPRPATSGPERQPVEDRRDSQGPGRRPGNHPLHIRRNPRPGPHHRQHVDGNDARNAPGRCTRQTRPPAAPWSTHSSSHPGQPPAIPAGDARSPRHRAARAGISSAGRRSAQRTSCGPRREAIAAVLRPGPAERARARRGLARDELTGRPARG